MTLPDWASDLHSYELLLGVAELGSIGRAARVHGMTQPAASVRLRRLESRIGATLLERTTRGARLTTAGELVVGWARPMLARAGDLVTGVEALRAEGGNHVRVAASLTIAEYLLPRWLIALRGIAPETMVALSSGNSRDVAARVLGGDAELGFVEGPGLPSGLAARDVATDELVVVVAGAHPWARRRGGVRAAELAGTPLVSREPGSGTRAALEVALRDHGGHGLVEPVLEVSSTTAIKAAAVGGIGPAVLSAHAVTPELEAGSLVRIAVRDLTLSRRLRAVWPRDREPRGAARTLLDVAIRRGVA